MAAAVLVVMIWRRFFAVITVVGAQINAVFIGLRATTVDLSRTVERAYALQDPAVEQKRTATPPRFKHR